MKQCFYALVTFLLVAALLFATYPNFTYDSSQTFESALSGIWSESDSASIIEVNATTEKYRGSQSMSVVANASTYAYVDAEPPTAKDSVSVGFWFRTGQYPAYGGGREVMYVNNTGNGAILRLYDGRDSGDNARAIWLSVATASKITVSDATWYWLTVKFVRNGTCSLAVYNTSGAQVGSTATGTATDFPAETIRFGTGAGSAEIITYFDEIYIDYADATFPLGPPTEDAAATRRRVVMIN